MPPRRSGAWAEPGSAAARGGVLPGRRVDSSTALRRGAASGLLQRRHWEDLELPRAGRGALTPAGREEEERDAGGAAPLCVPSFLADMSEQPTEIIFEKKFLKTIWFLRI